MMPLFESVSSEDLAKRNHHAPASFVGGVAATRSVAGGDGELSDHGWNRQSPRTILLHFRGGVFSDNDYAETAFSPDISKNVLLVSTYCMLYDIMMTFYYTKSCTWDLDTW